MAQAGRPRSDAALMAQLSAKLAKRNSSGRHHQTAVGTGGSSRGGSARSSAVEVVPSNSDPQFGVLVKTLNYLQTVDFSRTVGLFLQQAPTPAVKKLWERLKTRDIEQHEEPCPYTMAGTLVAALHALDEPLMTRKMFSSFTTSLSIQSQVQHFVVRLLLSKLPSRNGWLVENLCLLAYRMSRPLSEGGAGMEPSTLAIVLGPAVFQSQKSTGSTSGHSADTVAKTIKIMEALIADYDYFFSKKHHPGAMGQQQLQQQQALAPERRKLAVEDKEGAQARRKERERQKKERDAAKQREREARERQLEEDRLQQLERDRQLESKRKAAAESGRSHLRRMVNVTSTLHSPWAEDPEQDDSFLDLQESVQRATLSMRSSVNDLQALVSLKAAKRGSEDASRPPAPGSPPLSPSTSTFAERLARWEGPESHTYCSVVVPDPQHDVSPELLLTRQSSRGRSGAGLPLDEAGHSSPVDMPELSLSGRSDLATGRYIQEDASDTTNSLMDLGRQYADLAQAGQREGRGRERGRSGSTKRGAGGKRSQSQGASSRGRSNGRASGPVEGDVGRVGGVGQGSRRGSVAGGGGGVRGRSQSAVRGGRAEAEAPSTRSAEKIFSSKSRRATTSGGDSLESLKSRGGSVGQSLVGRRAVQASSTDLTDGRFSMSSLSTIGPTARRSLSAPRRRSTVSSSAQEPVKKIWRPPGPLDTRAGQGEESVGGGRRSSSAHRSRPGKGKKGGKGAPSRDVSAPPSPRQHLITASPPLSPTKLPSSILSPIRVATQNEVSPGSSPQEFELKALTGAAEDSGRREMLQSLLQSPELIKALIHLQKHTEQEQQRQRMEKPDEARSVIADSASSAPMQALQQKDGLPDEEGEGAALSLSEVAKLMRTFDEVSPEAYLPSSLVHLLKEHIHGHLTEPETEETKISVRARSMTPPPKKGDPSTSAVIRVQVKARSRENTQSEISDASGTVDKVDAGMVDFGSDAEVGSAVHGSWDSSDDEAPQPAAAPETMELSVTEIPGSPSEADATDDTRDDGAAFTGFERAKEEAETETPSPPQRRQSFADRLEAILNRASSDVSSREKEAEEAVEERSAAVREEIPTPVTIREHKKRVKKGAVVKDDKPQEAATYGPLHVVKTTQAVAVVSEETSLEVSNYDPRHGVKVLARKDAAQKVDESPEVSVIANGPPRAGDLSWSDWDEEEGEEEEDADDESTPNEGLPLKRNASYSVPAKLAASLHGTPVKEETPKTEEVVIRKANGQVEEEERKDAARRQEREKSKRHGRHPRQQAKPQRIDSASDINSTAASSDTDGTPGQKQERRSRVTKSRAASAEAEATLPAGVQRLEVDLETETLADGRVAVSGAQLAQLLALHGVHKATTEGGDAAHPLPLQSTEPRPADGPNGGPTTVTGETADVLSVLPDQVEEQEKTGLNVDPTLERTHRSNDATALDVSGLSTRSIDPGAAVPGSPQQSTTTPPSLEQIASMSFDDLDDSQLACLLPGGAETVAPPVAAPPAATQAGATEVHKGFRTVYVPEGVDLDKLISGAAELLGPEGQEQATGQPHEGQATDALQLAKLVGNIAKGVSEEGLREQEALAKASDVLKAQLQLGREIKIEAEETIKEATPTHAKAEEEKKPPSPSKVEAKEEPPKAEKKKESPAPPPEKKAKAPPPPPPPPPGGKGKGPPPPPPPPPGGKGKGPPPPPPPPGKGKKGGPPPPPPGKGVVAVKTTEEQRKKLKQLHWDKVTKAEGTVWGKTNAGAVDLDYAELESLFTILENDALRKLVKNKDETIRLVDNRRSHNICIELSGIRMPFADIKAALVNMDAGRLTIENLQCLARAVPDDSERRNIESYLAGKHPKHRGVSDPTKLGTVEQYFMEIMDIPRLQHRIEAYVFSKSFAATHDKVVHHLDVLTAACTELSECDDFIKVLEATLAVGNHLNQAGRNGGAAGFKLDTLLRLVDVKGKDRSTSLLHFVIRELTKTSTSISTLSQQMEHIKPASALQVTAIKTLMEELTVGMKQVNEEILAATCEEGQTHENFSSVMVDFATRAEEELKELRDKNRNMVSELKHLATFYGETYSEDEPTRVIHTVMQFLRVFDRAYGEVETKRAVDRRKAKAEAAAALKHSKSSPGLSSPTKQAGNSRDKMHPLPGVSSELGASGAGASATGATEERSSKEAGLPQSSPSGGQRSASGGEAEGSGDRPPPSMLNLPSEPREEEDEAVRSPSRCQSTPALHTGESKDEASASERAPENKGGLVASPATAANGCPLGPSPPPKVDTPEARGGQSGEEKLFRSPEDIKNIIQSSVELSLAHSSERRTSDSSKRGSDGSDGQSTARPLKIDFSADPFGNSGAMSHIREEMKHHGHAPDAAAESDPDHIDFSSVKSLMEGKLRFRPGGPPPRLPKKKAEAPVPTASPTDQRAKKIPRGAPPPQTPAPPPLPPQSLSPTQGHQAESQRAGSLLATDSQVLSMESGSPASSPAPALILPPLEHTPQKLPPLRVDRDVVSPSGEQLYEAIAYTPTGSTGTEFHSMETSPLALPPEPHRAEPANTRGAKNTSELSEDGFCSPRELSHENSSITDAAREEGEGISFASNKAALEKSLGRIFGSLG